MTVDMLFHIDKTFSFTALQVSKVPGFKKAVFQLALN